jgi:formate dehydrogenase subunit beta
MDSIIKKAEELLSSGKVNVVIGYGKGSSANRSRAEFITDATNASKLIYNEYCNQNLAVYLTKNEVTHNYKKIAIVANKYVMRAILQIASEEQVKEENLTVIGVGDDNQLIDFDGFASIESYLAQQNHSIPVDEKALIAKIDAMSLDEKWAFWEKELSRCFKCYACRQACPMCYCNRCMVEVNQPQWVHVPAHGLGNLEWHFMRAMHLAGRCVNCGDCAKACPMDIPLNLLTYKLIDSIKDDFDAVAGLGAKMDSVLSTFKVTDKEHFIK